MFSIQSDRTWKFGRAYPDHYPPHPDQVSCSPAGARSESEMNRELPSFKPLPPLQLFGQSPSNKRPIQDLLPEPNIISAQCVSEIRKHVDTQKSAKKKPNKPDL